MLEEGVIEARYNIIIILDVFEKSVDQHNWISSFMLEVLECDLKDEFNEAYELQVVLDCGLLSDDLVLSVLQLVDLLDNILIVLTGLKL